MRPKAIVLFTGLLIVIGIVNALVLRVFEFVVIDGTVWLWNDLLHSNAHRWIVLPITIIGSMLLSWGFRLTGEKRIVKPKVDLIAENEMPSGKNNPPVTIQSIATNLGLGMDSLMVGASLGPEASLMEYSKQIGRWSALKSNLAKYSDLIVLASVGALLIAFLGSLWPMFIPLLLLWQKGKLSLQKPLKSLSLVWPILVASLTAYGTLWVVDQHSMGFGDIPANPNYDWLDAVLALGLGMAAASLGWLLKYIILSLSQLTHAINARLHWLVAAAIFGFGIGALYLLGGQTVQFSGSVGSTLLVQQASTFTIWGLAAVLLVKLVVTAWSLAAGYRGGLVFPSIYIGVAVGLIVAAAFGVNAQGAMIGAIAGTFGALTGPAVGLIFITSILPWQLLPLAVIGIIGSAVGNKLIAFGVERQRQKRPPAP